MEWNCKSGRGGEVNQRNVVMEKEVEEILSMIKIKFIIVGFEVREGYEVRNVGSFQI